MRAMPTRTLISPYTPRISSPLNPTPSASISISPPDSPLLNPEGPSVDELRRRHKRKTTSIWDRLQRTKGALAWRKTMTSEGRETLEVEVEDGTGRFVYYTPPAPRVSAVRSSSGGYVMDDGAVTQSFCAPSKRKETASAEEGEARGKSEVGELSSDGLERMSEDSQGAVGHDSQHDDVVFWDIAGDIVDGEDGQDIRDHSIADEEGIAIFDDFIEINPMTSFIDTTQAENSDTNTIANLSMPDVDDPSAPKAITPARRPPLRRRGLSHDAQVWTLLRPITTLPGPTQPPQIANGMTTPVRSPLAYPSARPEAGPADRDASPPESLAYPVTAAAFFYLGSRFRRFS